MIRYWLLRSSAFVGLLFVLLDSPGSAQESRGADRGSAPTSVVQLKRTDEGWTFTRNGHPYFIRGAGGDASKELLAALGANSIRTWGTDGLEQKLNEAERLDLSVAVGIWLGHERHGFDYRDAEHVADQYEMVRETVLRFKDHPAVLLWGLGNEMEGRERGDNAAIWSAINNLATLVKKLDSNHPTMTVVGEIGGDRVRSIHRLCPDIDIIGINSYGGAASLPERFRNAGGTKPYILAEFGPLGPWEVAKTQWGAPIEPSSTEKGFTYRRSYQKGVDASAGMCLGSYAFLWGHKQEATATWFGMLLPDGTRLAPVDFLTSLWSGREPPDRCPIIHHLRLEGPRKVEPNAVVQANLSASDPEDQELQVSWVLQADSRWQGAGGDPEPVPESFPESIVRGDLRHAEVRMPGSGGAYRLFAFVRDGRGGGATANIPLLVEDDSATTKGMPSELPLVVYDEAGRAGLPFFPSGWMGNISALRFDDAWREDPHSGETCIRLDYAADDQWAAIAWQHPENDFGDRPGGWDLTGAKRLSLWLRGETGTERVKVELGILGHDKKYPDTAKATLANVGVSTEWREFHLELAGKDLSRIKTGLVVTIMGAPATIYIDDCRYE